MSIANFYVYEHIRKDTGAIFYVGKGHGNRANHPYKRNAYWKNVVNKANGFTVNYVAKNVDEELSLLCEMERINQLKKLGYKLTNATNGGEGISGYQHTKESKEKIGQYVATRIGANNPNYGKKQSAETIAKRVAKMTGELHPFYGKAHTEETRLKISENRKGKLIGADNPFFGKTHTEENKKKMSAPHKGAKRSEKVKYNMSVGSLKVAHKHKNAKPVFCITNGIFYRTINEAARELDLQRQCVRMVCMGNLKQTGGYIFEWGNK
jgi:hypothetical protein